MGARRGRHLDARFPLGRTVITATAHATLEPLDVILALRRHVSGDWGSLCEEDQASNEEALANGYRLLSAYEDSKGTRFWIITEWDRSYTTILLPSDY